MAALVASYVAISVGRLYSLAAAVVEAALEPLLLFSVKLFLLLSLPP